MVAILATLSGLGLVNYRSSIAIAEETVALKELQDLVATIELYEQQMGQLPETLEDLGMGTPFDPWGNPYQFLNFETGTGSGANQGEKRKDRFVVPLNTKYDLYSMGPDGRSVAALTAKDSQDDLVVANDGAFIGWAWQY